MYPLTMLSEVRMWRHVKTGGIYAVIGLSIDSTNGDRNGGFMVVYSDSEFAMYCRDADEFRDGRFEPLNSEKLKTLR